MDPDQELMKAIAEQKNAFEAFVRRYDDKYEELEARMNRQAFGLGGMAEGLGARTSRSEEIKALEKFLRTGEREVKAGGNAAAGETKGMVISSDPDGGYLVVPEIASEIAVIGAEQGAIRRLARGYTPGSADFRIPISPTMAGAGRTTESGQRSETPVPKISGVSPPSGGVFALVPITSWLLNDATFDVAAFVLDSIGQQFGFTEAADFVSGDGVNKAMGFLSAPLAATADASRAFGTVEKLHAGSTSDFDIDDLITLIGKLAPRYRKNAAFVMHPDTETYVRKLKSATSGEYYWQPSTAAGVPPTLLGYPSFVDANMPTIASAAGVVALSDWRKFYAIVDVGRTTVLRDPYTSKGNVLFYSERRTGGSVVDSNAGKVLVMSA